MPTNNWKLQTKGERWWQGETLSASIGQSFLLVTPIQIARMISSIYSGYLVKPRILENETIEQKKLKISQETRIFLNSCMETVVSEGTGQRLKNIPNLKVSAKTGTAQTSKLSNRQLGLRHKEHGWFVSNFQYKNQNALTLVILVENTGGSRKPTTIAKSLLTRYSKYMEQKNY